MTRLDILSAGRIYCDLVFTGLDAAPEPGREVFAERVAVMPGGGAHITARYAAALGLRAGVWGVLPAPPFDVCIGEDLARGDVAAHLHPAAPGSDPQLTAAIVRGGDRAFVTRRAGRALPEGPPPAARHLHLGELTTALEHPETLAAARAAGMTVSLDCGWDEAALRRAEVADIVAAVDLFLPNAAEAERLAAAGTALAPRAALVVKCGADGAWARHGSGTEARAPAERVPVVDTTGAGDAFNAGFLAAWLKGAPVERCLALGNAAGAVAVGRVGGAGAIPSLAYLKDGAARRAAR